MQISLPPDLQQFIEESVKKGQYATPDEVVADGLQLLREMPAWTEQTLREAINVGIEQIERGEVAPWDAEEVKAEGRRLLAEHKKRQ